jgi:cytochrome c peroxidase
MKTGLPMIFLACLSFAAVHGEAQDVDALGTPNVGERLFLETRFSEYFFTNSGGNANFKLTQGDPVMNTTVTTSSPLPGPFAGQAMNCRACHMVEEHENFGNRTYADFARRSPIPANGDARTQTPRNAIDLVDSLLPHSTPLFLHYDGQFATVQDLIIETLTGRNYGWKPSEYATAVAHIASIIRKDSGGGALAIQYGASAYWQAFNGGESILSQYQILPAFRLYNVTVTNPAAANYVSDEQILQGIAALIQSYMETLVFSQDASGQFDGSPYDVFLIKNGLPRQPAGNETPLQYSQRLLQLVVNLPNPQFVTDPADGHFQTHDQTFAFGPTELAGLKIFFAVAKNPASPGIQGATGNCVRCHTPPAFTDFLFHNTGAAQEEYDANHGTGTFMALAIPGLSERQTNYDAYLEPTTNHPNATGKFITPPTLAQPGQVDLGLWNVFANPDIPGPQAALQQILPLLVPTPTPQISGVTMTGTNLIVTGAGGAPGWTYYVSFSTSLASPAADWNIFSTNTFDSEGGFNFTSPILASAQGFYRLSVAPLSPALALPRMIALFKTPNVRDLGSSDPYFHTGRMDTIENVISFYQTYSALARSGFVRNVAPELSGISLDDSAVQPLAAFLRALNEDYFDIPCPCQP